MKWISIIFFIGFLNPVYTQTEEDKVKNTIDLLFDGMREGDSAKTHLAFHENVRMMTCFTNQNQKPIVKEDHLIDFLNAVGTPHDIVWDEKLTSFEIKVDGYLAQVWTSYKFYTGENFSHCGVNAFQLVKSEIGDWKILHLTDTRRKENCN